MNKQELQKLDKLAVAAMKATGTYEVNGLGKGLRDAVAEVRRLRRILAYANPVLLDV